MLATAASAPGRLTVRGSGVVIEVTGAVADSAGGELRMTIRNSRSIQEELAMVEEPGGLQGVPVGGGSDDGSLSPAGIELDPDSTTVFGGGGGPRGRCPTRADFSAAAPPRCCWSSESAAWST